MGGAESTVFLSVGFCHTLSRASDHRQYCKAGPRLCCPQDDRSGARGIASVTGRPSSPSVEVLAPYSLPDRVQLRQDRTGAHAVLPFYAVAGVVHDVELVLDVSAVRGPVVDVIFEIPVVVAQS